MMSDIVACLTTSPFQGLKNKGIREKKNYSKLWLYFYSKGITKWLLLLLLLAGSLQEEQLQSILVYLMFSLSVKQSFCIFLSWIWVGLDWGRLILPCSSPGKQLASLSLLWYLRKMRNPSMAHQLICCLGPDWPERILKLAVQWKLLKGFESHTLKMIMKLENERKRLSRKDVQEAKRFPNCKDNQTPATGVAFPQLSNPSLHIQEPCILWRKISTWMLSLVYTNKQCIHKIIVRKGNKKN